MQKSFRVYVIFWLTQTLSQLGSAMTAYALVLWVYAQTGRAFSVSLLTLCSSVPYLVTSVFSGNFVDSHYKKNIILAADGIAFLCTLFIFAMHTANALAVWMIYGVNILIGFANAYQGPASSVLSGMLVDEDKITKMSGLQSVSGSAVGIFAPVVASFVLSIFGLSMVLLIDGIAFVLAAFVLLVFVRVKEESLAKRERGIRNVFEGVKEGYVYLKGAKTLLFAFLIVGLMNLLTKISFENILSPMILSRSGSQEVLGIVTGLMGVGGVRGGFVTTLLKEPKSCAGRICLGGLLSFLTGDLLLDFGRNVAVWGISAVISCLPLPLLDSGLNVLLYTKTPKEMQGRVFAVRNLVKDGSIPIGLLCGGLMADNVFEPMMQGNGAFVSFLQRLVGSGAGSGMAVMFLLTGTIGILSCGIGYFVMNKLEKKENSRL